MMEIGVCVELNSTQKARLRCGAGDWPVEFLGRSQHLDHAIVFGNPPPRAIEQNAKLRWLQLESAGFGEFAGLDWRRGNRPVLVTNLAGFFADPVAETALAGLLALGRGIDRLERLRTERRWVGDALRETLHVLTGAGVVLFGRGAILSRFGELLEPFHCKIRVFGSDWTSAALDCALAGADIVAAAVPHTPATENVFSAERLARLKPDAVFCNLGRGSLVDEGALADMLGRGRLRGAVIDVTRDEPLPPDHPFWNTPNTILTQHTGGGTADEIDRKIDAFLANLGRFRAGRPLAGLVDFQKGY